MNYIKTSILGRKSPVKLSVLNCVRKMVLSVKAIRRMSLAETGKHTFAFCLRKSGLSCSSFGDSRQPAMCSETTQREAGVLPPLAVACAPGLVCRRSEKKTTWNAQGGAGARGPVLRNTTPPRFANFVEAIYFATDAASPTFYF